MAKRFTDTDKWKKPFIRALPPEYKLFWFYLLDDCDHSGIWQVDLEIAEIRLGVKLSLQKALGFFKERIVVFDNETKWFLPDFISFQYGVLADNNRAHKAVLNNLKKYSLMVVGCPLQGAKDKDKEQEKDKDRSEKIKGLARAAFDDRAWMETQALGHSMNFDQLKKWMAQYNGSLMADTREITISDYKRMFGGWLNTQKGKGYNLPEKNIQTGQQLPKLN